MPQKCLTRYVTVIFLRNFSSFSCRVKNLQLKLVLHFFFFLFLFSCVSSIRAMQTTYSASYTPPPSSSFPYKSSYSSNQSMNNYTSNSHPYSVAPTTSTLYIPSNSLTTTNTYQPPSIFLQSPAPRTVHNPPNDNAINNNISQLSPYATSSPAPPTYYSSSFDPYPINTAPQPRSDLR